jgi:Fimbrial assembly protein (PilN)
MRAMELDFIAQKPRTSIAGLLLLLAGLIACAWVIGRDYTDRMPRAAQLDSQIAQLRKAQEVRRSTERSINTVTPEMAASAARAQAVSSQLSMPWNRMFDAVALASKSDSAALLAIEPDMQKQQVVLVGEAKNQQAMLQFLKNIQASPDFTEVVLKSHSFTQNPAGEGARQAPSAPVRSVRIDNTAAVTQKANRANSSPADLPTSPDKTVQFRVAAQWKANP